MNDRLSLAITAALSLLAGELAGQSPRGWSPEMNVRDVALAGGEVGLIVETYEARPGLGIFGGPATRRRNYRHHFVRFRLPEDPAKPAQWLSSREFLTPEGDSWGEAGRGAAYLYGCTTDRVVRIEWPGRDRIDLFGDGGEKGWGVLRTWKLKGQSLISPDGRYLIRDPGRPEVIDQVTLKLAGKVPPRIPFIVFNAGPLDIGGYYLFDAAAGRLKRYENNNTPRDPKAFDLTDARLVGGRPLFLGRGAHSLDTRGRQIAVLDEELRVLHQFHAPSDNWSGVFFRLAGDTPMGPGPQLAVHVPGNEGPLKVWDYGTGRVVARALRPLDGFVNTRGQYHPKR